MTVYDFEFFFSPPGRAGEGGTGSENTCRLPHPMEPRFESIEEQAVYPYHTQSSLFADRGDMWYFFSWDNHRQQGFVSKIAVLDSVMACRWLSMHFRWLCA